MNLDHYQLAGHMVVRAPKQRLVALAFALHVSFLYGVS